MRLFPSSLLLAALAVAGCNGLLSSEPAADHRIQVVQSHGKAVAVPPACADWSEKEWGHPWSNDTWPSYGCAQARNLAAQVENPKDLIKGHDLGPADPITSTAAVARYQSGKTTPLIDPNVNNPQENQKMEDTRVGGAPKK